MGLIWYLFDLKILTYWGLVTHICISKQTIIGSDNGVFPGQCIAIIWTSAGILLMGPLETNLSEILIVIHTFLLRKMHLKMYPGKWRLFCLDLNVLTSWSLMLKSSPTRYLNFTHVGTIFKKDWASTFWLLREMFIQLHIHRRWELHALTIK